MCDFGLRGVTVALAAMVRVGMIALVATVACQLTKLIDRILQVAKRTLESLDPLLHVDVLLQRPTVLKPLERPTNVVERVSHCLCLSASWLHLPSSAH